MVTRAVAPPSSATLYEPPSEVTSMVALPELRHPGLDALREAAADFGAAEGWLQRPPDSWFPEEDAVLLAQVGNCRSTMHS